MTTAGCFGASVHHRTHPAHSNKTNVPDPSLTPAPTGTSTERGAARMAGRFAVRSAIAVGSVQAVLLVPYVLGWMSGIAFGICSAVLSSLAVGILSYRTARVLHNVRDVIVRFWSAADDGASQAAANSNWTDLDASLIQLHERTRQRLSELKASREAVVRQNSANRRIADHLKQAQRIARVGSWEWERKTNRVVCSEEVFRLLHVDREQFRPTTASLLELIHEDDRRAFRRWIIRLSHGAEPHGIDLRMHAPDGTLVHLHVLGEVFRRLDERTVGVMGTIQDATERTHAIQQIHRLAYYDVLTELPNRSRFHEKLAETLDMARRTGKAFAIMFLDLDQFKRINDTLGHAVGDDLLRIIAQRLTRVLRVEDPAGARGKAVERDVCRQGGDEFIVLLNGVGTEEQAARAANRVIETLAQPITIGSSEVFVSASIGIVLFPRDGEDLDSLLKNADVAMYHAKAEGRNRLLVLSRLDAPGDGGAAVARARPAPGDRRGAIRAALPAADRRADQSHHRHGSADPLEPSHARHAVAAALHPGRGRGWPDHGDLGMGVRVIADPAQRLAPGRPSADDDQRQPVEHPVHRLRTRRTREGDRKRHRRADGARRARAHRVRADARISNVRRSRSSNCANWASRSRSTTSVPATRHSRTCASCRSTS